MKRVSLAVNRIHDFFSSIDYTSKNYAFSQFYSYEKLTFGYYIDPILI